MRTKNSVKNTIFSMLSNLVAILIGFLAQAVFIQILGIEYLGVNGLFTNIISMLGIVELGVGSAIIYNLYQPIEKKDKKTIKSLMRFYQKAYHIIAIIVFILGICVLPFLNFFVGEVHLDLNLQVIYFLFIIDIVCSYLLSYKRSILYADQKNYIIQLIHMGYLILLNGLQLLVLYFSKNYYLYLIVKIIMRLLENLVISIIACFYYPYLSSKKIEKLDAKIEKDIFQKVKALFFHKIGAFIILGTDNIIISKFLGVVVVGLYSNYYLIINSVQMLFGQAIAALTPSVGSLLITDSKSKVYEVFKKVRFMNFWIATFTAVSLLLIMQPFIKIWVGQKYLLDSMVLYVLVFNFFMTMMRYSYITFKEAAGIFYEDRFVPLIESLFNIIFSCILVKWFGLSGVFMGTIISGLVLWGYSYPKYVYRYLFEREYRDYLKETCGYIFLFLFIAGISYFLSLLFIVDTAFLQVVINVFLSLFLPNILIFFFFHRTEQFRYFKKLVLGPIKK